MGKVSKESLQRQFEATSKWSGVCNRLSTITKPTLVITGTEDITTPPANSITIAEKIPGSWLVQIKGGGHGVMFQYPQQFASILLDNRVCSALHRVPNTIIFTSSNSNK